MLFLVFDMPTCLPIGYLLMLLTFRGLLSGCYRTGIDDDRPRLMPKEDGGFGSAGPVTAPSSSRARMLAQQRELQLKKRESVTSTGGMIRSSVDGADALRRSSEHRFTPAVRQFSAPKAVKDSSAE